MRKILLLTLLTILGGASSVKAETVKLYSTGFSGYGGGVSYSEGILSWTKTSDNVCTAISFDAGVLSYFNKIKLTCSGLTEGASFRVIVVTKDKDDPEKSVNFIKSVTATGTVEVAFNELIQQWQSNTMTEEQIAQATQIRIGGGSEGTVPASLTIDPTSICLETSWEAPMQIGTTADWNGFSLLVKNGLSSLNATMTADVDAGSTMVGTDADGKRYTGSFDGAGHTLSFSYEGDGQFAAPFSCIDGATINDLLTTGTITTSYNMPGGIVGKNVGISTLTRCGSSMTLSTTDASNGRIGGLVGRCADGNQMIFNNCLYNGSISTATSGYACGFVGWDNQPEKITLNNCLVAASSITGGRQNFINDTPIIPDGKYALYISKFGSSTQGTAVTDAQRYNGYVAYTLSSDISEGTLFFGQNLKSLSSSPILTSNTAYKVYSLGGGEYANMINTITSTEDWVLFSKLVAAGETNMDVTMTADVNAGNTMVGADFDGKRYSGSFDGAGHTLTFNYSGSDTEVGPFKCVQAATFKDLHVTGAITSSGQLIAGFIGKNLGATTITRCYSSVDLTTNHSDSRPGGFVGRSSTSGATITFSYCMYDGKIDATKQGCGFVGWAADQTMNVNHSLVASTSVSGGGSNFIGGYGTKNISSSYYLTQFGESTEGTLLTDQLRYSGQAAYTLNQDISDGAWFFGQGYLNSSRVEEIPSLTSDASKKVYKASNEALYANSDGLLPDPALSGKLAWKMAMTWDPIYFVTLPAASASNFNLYGSADSYILNVSSAGATTLVVPFDVEEANIPSGVKVYNLSFDGTDITATRVNSITANEPVLINAPEGEYRLESGIDYATTINFSSYGTPTNGALTGVYNTSLPFSYVPKDAYVLQNGPEGLCFYQVDAENTIKITSFRAYLTADAGDARALTIKFPDDETAINQVQGSGVKVQDSEIFNLAGQRMSKLQKGVNIVNGKKIMVK